MSSNKYTVKIWYLYHSGFAIKTENHFLIFDYYTKPGFPFSGPLSSGLIQANEIREENVVVLSSHRHPDHFDKRILEWSETIPNLKYILSDDIKLPQGHNTENITLVHFNKEYTLDKIKINTLHSTDEGVAFLLEIDGITIYHAGDLNWWHWIGESKHYNDSMAGQYKHEIDTLKGRKIDIAFLPLDPRLEENYLLGVDYFMKKINPDIVFPMHFGDKYEVFDWLQKDPRADSYRDRIQNIHHSGELFKY